VALEVLKEELAFFNEKKDELYSLRAILS